MRERRWESRGKLTFREVLALGDRLALLGLNPATAKKEIISYIEEWTVPFSRHRSETCRSFVHGPTHSGRVNSNIIPPMSSSFLCRPDDWPQLGPMNRLRSGHISPASRNPR